jgi:cation-transporting ATPase 13A2
MITALFISTYMLADPAGWLVDLMELTYMSLEFKMFLLGLAAAGFAVMYFSEIFVFPNLAKWIGILKVKVAPKTRKKRKEYKIIAEGMRF